MTKEAHSVHHLDLSIYRAIVAFEEAWTPNEAGSVDGPVFSERERQSLLCFVKRSLKNDFEISKIQPPEFPGLGKQIRSGRINKGLTQKVLAMRIGVHYQTVLEWEKGRMEPDPDNWKALEKVLEVALDKRGFRIEHT